MTLKKIKYVRNLWFIICVMLCCIFTSQAQPFSDEQILKYDSAALQFHPTNSYECIKRALENHSRAEDIELKKSTKAKVLQTVGIAYNGVGDFVKSIDFLLASNVIFENLDDKKNLLLGFNAIGGSYYNIGDFDKTIKYSEKSLAIARELKLYVKVSTLLNNLSGAYRELEQLTIAMDYANKALKVAEQYDLANPNLYAQSTTADIFLDMKEYDSALYFYNKALDFGNRKEVLTIYETCFIQYGKAQCFWKLSEIDSAFKYSNIAYQIAQEQNYLSFKRDAAGLLSDIWFLKGRLDSKYYYQTQVLVTSDSIWSKEKELQLNRIVIKHKDSEILSEKEKNKEQSALVLASFIIGVLLILVLIILILAYYNRQKHYKKAKQQKGVIEEKNTLLQSKTKELQHMHLLKDKMFSMVVHDFKTPLNSLESMLSLISNKYMTAEEAIVMANKLTKDIQKSKTSVNNLIVWAKSQMGGSDINRILVDIENLLLEVKDYHSHQAASKNIQLKLVLPKNHKIFTDKERLLVVINNLVSNAIKFTEYDGVVTIEFELLDNDMIIKVADTGIGIDKKNQSKIFNASFYTSDGTSSEKGTGLGLIICKDLIEDLDGTITVSSKENQGTTFFIKVPIEPQ